MSYCVNCGVELDPSAKTCPLCRTPAWHPELDAPPYFPANSAAVQPASRREAAILLTAMLVSVSLCCGLFEPVSAHGPSLVPVRHRGGGDAVGLVHPAYGAAAAAGLFSGSPPMWRPLASMSGSSPSTWAAAAGSGAGPAHDRLGWGAGLSFELSAPGRAALHTLHHCPDHRGGWASGGGH